MVALGRRQSATAKHGQGWQPGLIACRTGTPRNKPPERHRLRRRHFQAALTAPRSLWGCSEAPLQALGDSKLQVKLQAVLCPIPHFPWAALCFPEPGTPWGSQDAPKEATTCAEGSLGRHCDTRLLLAAGADPRFPYPNRTTGECGLPLGRTAKLPRKRHSPALQLQPA